MDVVHAAHPGVGVLNCDEPPGEGAGYDEHQSAAGGEAKAVSGNLRGPITALGIVRQGAVTVVPRVEELVFQRRVIDFVSHLASAEQHLGERRPATGGQRRPAWSRAVKQGAAALRVLGEAHDEAAVHFGDDLPVTGEAGSTRAAATDAIASGEAFEVRIGG